MKIASGVDLIEIERVIHTTRRYGQRFLGRIFTPQELLEAEERPGSLAARFAAKEAVAKALGTGIGPVSWQEIEVVYGPARQPLLRLSGAAQRIAQEQGLKDWSISLSHTASHAIALVVATGE